MSRQRYTGKESINRVLKLFRGEVPDEQPNTLRGEILSTNQAASDIAELVANSLPGETLTLPQSVVDAIVDAGFSGGGITGYVVVESEDDFPVAVGGTITLVANTIYEVFGDVTVTSSIDLNNSAIVGQSFRVNSLTYTPSSGSMFTGSEGGYLEQLQLSANGGGTSSLFGLTGSSTKALQVRQCTIVGSNLGTISGGYNIVQFFFCSFGTNTDSLNISDGNIVNFNSCAWFSTNTASPYIDLDGDITTVQWLGGNLDTGNGNTLTGLDISGISSLERGTINGGAVFLGSGIYVTGTFGNEWEVEARGLQTNKDEVALGALYISSSAETTIASADTPVKLAGTTLLESSSFRVSMPEDNRLQYDGTLTRTFQINCALSVTAAANNKVYNWHIYKNGSPITGATIQRKQGTGTDVGALALNGIVELSTGDYVEIWVEGLTDTTNVTGNFANLVIS